jgi:hypothetical protein
MAATTQQSAVIDQAAAGFDGTKRYRSVVGTGGNGNVGSRSSHPTSQTAGGIAFRRHRWSRRVYHWKPGSGKILVTATPFRFSTHFTKAERSKTRIVFPPIKGPAGLSVSRSTASFFSCHQPTAGKPVRYICWDKRATKSHCWMALPCSIRKSGINSVPANRSRARSL